MCRSTDYHHHHHILHRSDRNRNPNGLKIKSFIVRLSDLNAPNPLPESLTLLFLPRIKENALEIDGSKIRPGSPAIVSLHRVIAAQPHQVIFGSRQRVRASQGLRFEVYLSKAMFLKGILRKDHNHQFKLECELQVDDGHGHGVAPTSTSQVSEAEVCVAVERELAITKRVTTVTFNFKRKRSRKPFKFNEWELEDIPEERELSYSDCNNIDTVSVSDHSCCASCSCACDDSISDAQSNSNYPDPEYEDGLDVEGVRWAVDLGIWVMCLGLGYLVSKASIKSISFARRPRIFFGGLFAYV